MTKATGGFTIPGEAGHEALTLALAKEWGADMIRDSDGTTLSAEILESGYDICSTICLIRDHNAWAKANLDKHQQTFLSTPPAIACIGQISIPLLEVFFAAQFEVNDRPEAMAYWQVYDRTTGEPLKAEYWKYDRSKRCVLVTSPRPFHRYTVSFLAWRRWEEISMYNHTTNGWDSEPLMQLDPRYPDVRAYLSAYLDEWCASHPATTVVRFTALFYNFAWIWGADERRRHLFSDWGSYDFTVSEAALAAFNDKYGYSLCAEDFVNGGKYRVTHMPPTKEKLDWMYFIHDFVVDFATELVEIVHRHGKEAYLFYDDSWVGAEPYGPRFHEMDFDGLIKCVFSGFEARLCAGVDVRIHELRLHPYLFPVGLNGAPTFADGGDPARDALGYWLRIRRALLFAPVERIGLGGYLHLVKERPEFIERISAIADEFRQIKALHDGGRPRLIPLRVAILHAWGELRSWTLSGHFHECEDHDLIHVIEALSGLPIELSFISFEDIVEGVTCDLDVVINVGRAGDAWSGGDGWDAELPLCILTEWVNKGGAFIGINQPSALPGHDTFFRMAHVLGVDEDDGARVCHGRFAVTATDEDSLVPPGVSLRRKERLYLVDAETRVLLADSDLPLLTLHPFGKGQGIYLTSFSYSSVHTQLLYRLLCYGAKFTDGGIFRPVEIDADCAYFPAPGKLAVLNNATYKRKLHVQTPNRLLAVTVAAHGMEIVDV